MSPIRHRARLGPAAAVVQIPELHEEWQFDLDDLDWLVGHLPAGDGFTQELSSAAIRLRGLREEGETGE